jgi:hypothetical protein
VRQYLRLVHNLSDREYDHGQMKHQLLSEAEIRSVEHFAVYDALKQYVFIGGCNQGDGVLRCPAAGQRDVLDMPAGWHPESLHTHDADVGVVSDAIWDNSFPADKGCEHYHLTPQNEAAAPNRSSASASGEQAGAPTHWSPPPQGARARAVRATEAGSASDSAAGAAGERDDEQQGAGSTAAAARDAADTDVFGHMNLVPSGGEGAGRTSRPGRRDGACLSTRRVQEGSDIVGVRKQEKEIKVAIKEKDQVAPRPPPALFPLTSSPCVYRLV